MNSNYYNFFAGIYGSLWPELFESLKKEDRHVLRANGFYFSLNNLVKHLEIDSGVGAEIKIPPLSNCFEVGTTFNLNNYQDMIFPFYKMDAASIVPPLALEVKSGDLVLDMCAAPGGKTLILAEKQTLRAGGKLIANEFSAKRKHRLMSVIKRYIPSELRSMVHIHGQDGNLYGLKTPNSFDKILLDAPCSGDRDLIQSPQELELWKEKRTKSFGIRQYSLLASALSALKPGGRLVYSTCSLSPYENDEVIKKLIKRRGVEFNIEKSNFENWGDNTEYGKIITPVQNGFGPIYFCIISKF